MDDVDHVDIAIDGADAVDPDKNLIKGGGAAHTQEKDGPVITDQGNMVLDVKFDRIDDPEELNRTLNTIPGVVDSGLFVGAANVVLVGEMKQGEPVVWEM